MTMMMMMTMMANEIQTKIVIVSQAQGTQNAQQKALGHTILTDNTYVETKKQAKNSLVVLMNKNKTDLDGKGKCKPLPAGEISRATEQYNV